MKILIADDEKLARLRLCSLLSELDDSLEIIVAENGYQALKKYKQTQADILLLDIRMPQIDGLEVARELMKFDTPPAVIFTTAYDSHALQAFEANAIDYLLKPVRKDRLQTALEKARTLRLAQLQTLHETLKENEVHSHLCVHKGNDLQLIAVNDILYFHAEQKYVIAKTLEHEYLLDESLKALEEEFTGLFLRIHRNALVSIQHIEELHKQADGQVLIKFHHSDETLPVSRRLVSKVRQCLKEFKNS